MDVRHITLNTTNKIGKKAVFFFKKKKTRVVCWVCLYLIFSGVFQNTVFLGCFWAKEIGPNFLLPRLLPLTHLISSSVIDCTSLFLPLFLFISSFYFILFCRLLFFFVPFPYLSLPPFYLFFHSINIPPLFHGINHNTLPFLTLSHIELLA